VYRILPWIRQYLETAAGQGRSWFFEDVLQKFYCREIYAIIDISFYGDIQPCGLAPARISIHENRERGLLTLWEEATLEIKEDLEQGRYRPYCNGCCHHFSRNMLASMLKYPMQNRSALLKMTPYLFLRIISGISKKIKFSIK
jgi:sulfatase maturation enzyme AslB (radical SAM superfamily)